MYDTLTRKLRSLGTYGANIVPSKLCGPDFEPTREDALNGIADLQLLARYVDDALLAHGLYYQSLGLIDECDVRDHFTNVLANAIDGNATFCLERGVENRIEERMEAAE